MARPFKPESVKPGIFLYCPHCERILVTDNKDRNAPFIDEGLLSGWDVPCPFCQTPVRCPIGFQPETPVMFHSAFLGLMEEEADCHSHG
jgi:hypothetical protein